MRIAKRTREILDILDERYGTEIPVYLEHENAGQLLVATILSAQCTDARVNMVTKQLFKKYPDMAALASASIPELEEAIRSTGFYHNKAKNIQACARTLMAKYQGEVPSDLEALTALPGVGRKTANVIRGNIYHEPSVVVDTHVRRISWRLGITDEKDPEKIEYDIMKKLPRDHWIRWNTQIIAHGRSICMARNPSCRDCPLTAYCREPQKNGLQK